MSISLNRAGSLHLEDAQILFDVGDRVRFATNDGDTLSGTVEKLNPKRARVQCGDAMWTVPYRKLSANRRLVRDLPED